MPASYRGPMKDFSRPRTEKKFQIDGDVFEAAPAIPGDVLAEFGTRFDSFSREPGADRLSILSDALELILFPESFARLKTRLRDQTNPVELAQLSDIIVWLLEEYGLRPTQPSSASPDGQPSPESGMTLTGSFLPGESISTLSPQIVS